jgi:two-component system cell cycle response regulator CtrA
MNVLLVEDDPITAAKIEFILEGENFAFDSTALGETAIEQGKLGIYDIIILDLLLPDMDGYEVLRQLRAARVHTPVLILSGLHGTDDKVKGLRLGADDFLTKPFEARELIARIQAVVRRSKRLPVTTIRTGEMLVNLDSGTVAVGGQPVPFTPKEYSIVELLSLRKGMALTKEFLLHQLYGGFNEPGIRIIDVFISKVRNKLAQATGGNPVIETARGSGFVLRDPVERAPERA